MCNCNGGTVDYVCPYSKKISFALDKVVFPLIQKQYAGKVKVILESCWRRVGRSERISGQVFTRTHTGQYSRTSDTDSSEWIRVSSIMNHS